METMKLQKRMPVSAMLSITYCPALTSPKRSTYASSR